ncbi:MAG TPA: DUF222 domain-containing protein, partial [Methylomirabilota bacterium]|nr:DUF222 domain-containing protein [Methylomirabilota bacterium]
TSLPASVPMSSAVSSLAAAVDLFCSRDRSGMTAEQVGFEMVHLRHQSDRLEVEFSKMASEFAATDEYMASGSISPIHWIRHNCHMGSGAAADRVAVGDQAAGMQLSVDAVESGDIGFAHLTLIARTASAVEEGGSDRRIDEARLLAKARDLSVGRFRDFCFHARHMADAAAFVAGEISAVEARYFEMKLGESGLYSLRGTLDGEGGATLRTALEPLARRSGEGDNRNRGRRLADALIELGAQAGGGVRAHLQVTTSLETLLQRAGAPAADLEHALPISARAMERLACDCNITRILLNADSCVIDVGRSRRNISGPTRKALKARDQGCGWPGCDRPATWTSGHHIVFWTRGGPTDLPNLVLLCYRHHWMVHEGAWQLVRADDGQMLAIPPRMDGPLPRTRGPGEEAA